MKRLGFTLVEIMIVVGIIGLLAAMALPSFVRARTEAQRNACINNLRMIDAGKEQAALAWKLALNAAVNASSVNDYIKGNTTPECPGGGAYTYGNVGANPTCNISGHALAY